MHNVHRIFSRSTEKISQQWLSNSKLVLLTCENNQFDAMTKCKFVRHTLLRKLGSQPWIRSWWFIVLVPNVHSIFFQEYLENISTLAWYVMQEQSICCNDEMLTCKTFTSSEAGVSMGQLWIWDAGFRCDPTHRRRWLWPSRSNILEISIRIRSEDFFSTHRRRWLWVQVIRISTHRRQWLWET